MNVLFCRIAVCNGECIVCSVVDDKVIFHRSGGAVREGGVFLKQLAVLIQLINRIGAGEKALENGALFGNVAVLNAEDDTLHVKRLLLKIEVTAFIRFPDAEIVGADEPLRQSVADDVCKGLGRARLIAVVGNACLQAAFVSIARNKLMGSRALGEAVVDNEAFAVRVQQPAFGGGIAVCIRLKEILGSV